jgi:RNA polymerase sigma-70 factor (ECF subfamily)
VSSPPSAIPEFRRVFEDELEYVWTTLRRLGIRTADLPDVTQEVMLTVNGILSDYDPSRPLRPWLFGIAYRVALRHRAKAHVRREVLGEVEERIEPTRPDDDLQHAEDRALARAALETIEVEKRAVLVMTDVEGLAVPDVAQALGIPLNTAYSRLRRGREAFAEAVRTMRPQEDWT